jgi:hypothetical protein
MRRRNRLPGYKHALGLLAYAEAFQSLLGQVKRRPNGGFLRISSGPVYDFQHTRLSLEATIEERSFRMSTHANLVGLGVATILATAALWIGAVQISGNVCAGVSGCSPPGFPTWAAELLRWTIEYPEGLFGILVLGGGLYIEFTRRALLHLAPLGAYARFITEWAVAGGASISRIARKWFPAHGDNVGNGTSVGITAAILAMLIYSAGALFRLWGWLALFRALLGG